MTAKPKKNSIFDVGGSIKGSVTHFGFLGISKALSQVTNLILLAVITNQLGPLLFGKMNIFFMVTQFLFLAVASWTANAYTRYAILCPGEGIHVSEAFWCRNFVMLCVAVALTLAVIAGKSHLLAYLGMPAFALWLVVFHVLALILVDYTNQTAQVTARFKQLAILQLLEKGLILCLAWLFGRDVWSFLVIIIGLTILFRGAFLFTDDFKLFRPLRGSWRLSKRMLKFSVPFMLVSFGGYIFGWVDVAVIKQFATLESVGIYFLAYSGLGTIESIVLIMSTLLTPIAVALAAKGEVVLTERFIQRLIPQIYYLWGIVFMLVALIAPWGVPLAFGQDFLPSANVFLVLMMCLHFSVLNALALSIFIGYDMVAGMALINLFAALVNTGLDILLVPAAGIYGAVLATVASYTCLTLCYYRMLSRRFHFNLLGIIPFGIIACLQIVGLVLVKTMSGDFVLTVGAIILYLAWGRRRKIFAARDKEDYAALELPGFVRVLFHRLCDYHA